MLQGYKQASECSHTITCQLLPRPTYSGRMAGQHLLRMKDSWKEMKARENVWGKADVLLYSLFLLQFQKYLCGHHKPSVGQSEERRA